MADFENNENTPITARVVGNRDVVGLPSYFKWLAEGKIFEAGQGIQTVGIDSGTTAAVTPDDEIAAFALVAPAGKTPLVVPLFLKIMYEGEGNPANDIYLIFTKSAGQCATTLALVGRDMINEACMYQTSPVKAGPAASPLYGVATSFALAVSALVDADAILYDMVVLVDNNITVPLPGSSQQYSYNFMRGAVPHILTSGAAMIGYCNAADTDSILHPYMQWAELEPDDLL